MAERRKWEFGRGTKPTMAKEEIERKFVPYPMADLYRAIYGSKDSTFQRMLSPGEIKHILKLGAGALPKSEHITRPLETSMPLLSPAEESEFRKLDKRAFEAGGEHTLPLVDQVRYLQLYYMRGSENVDPLAAGEAKQLALLQTKALRQGKESLNASERKRINELIGKLGVTFVTPAKQRK